MGRLSSAFVAALLLGAVAVSCDGTSGIASAASAVPARPARPALLKPFKDQVSGATISRVTDLSQSPGATRLRHYYSKQQPWNADRTRAVIWRQDGATLLYDANTWKPLSALQLQSSDAEIQWHPTDPRIFYFMDFVGNSPNVRGLHVYDIQKNSRKLLKDFPEYETVRGQLEGNLDRDGRYYALIGRKGARREAFVLDLQTLSTGNRIVVSERQSDDWISMSPSGKYVVMMGGDRSRVYSRDMQLLREFPQGSFGHGDLCTRADGSEVLVYDGADRQLDDNRNINEIELETGRERILVRIGWGTTPHVSCRNIDRPGYALISTQGPDDRYPDRDFQIFWVSLDDRPKVRFVAHHYSSREDGGYFAEQHAVPSRDGSLIMFASSWGDGPPLDYVVDLNQGPAGIQISPSPAR